MRLDLIDEFRLDLHPYVAGEGARLSGDVPKSGRLDLVSSTAFSNGTIGLRYRRPCPAATAVTRLAPCSRETRR